MRRTHLYGLPVAWEMFLLFFAFIYPITYFAFYLPHFFLLHSNENSIFYLPYNFICDKIHVSFVLLTNDLLYICLDVQLAAVLLFSRKGVFFSTM